MSLSRTLLQAVTEAEKAEAEARGPVYESIDPTAYQNENAASLIAMETAEALHDVFLESFYGTEQADLLAVKEGIALEGSQYEVIVEGLSVQAIDKIKSIVTKLREKARAFIDYIIRQIDSVIMDTSNFFKKHDAELQRLKGLKDFKFTMYNYDDAKFESFLEQTVKTSTDACSNAVNTSKEFLSNISDGGELSQDEGVGQASDMIVESLKKMMSDEVFYSQAANSQSVKDAKTFKTYVFGIFRNGATSSKDKKEMCISDVYSKIQVVKNFNAEPVKKIRQKMEAVYSDAISTIDTVKNNVAKMGGPNAAKTAEVFRLMSSMLSKSQNMQNIVVSEWNIAVKERDVAYKQMAMKAFSYLRKVK